MSSRQTRNCLGGPLRPRVIANPSWVEEKTGMSRRPRFQDVGHLDGVGQDAERLESSLINRLRFGVFFPSDPHRND